MTTRKFATCTNCSETFSSTWSLWPYDNSISLGIDCYFLSTEEPSCLNTCVLHCFCYSCWVKEIKNLSCVRIIQQKLYTADSDLVDVKNILILTKQQLAQKNQDLINTQQQLAQKNQDLVNTQQQLAQKNQDLVNTQQQLAQKNQDLINTQQQLVNAQTELDNKSQELVDQTQELQLLQSQYENVPAAIIQSFKESEFHVFDKILHNFTVEENLILVECGFDGWEITLNGVINGFKEVLKRCVGDCVQHVSKCILVKTEALQQKQKNMEEMIVQIETQLKADLAPISVIEHSTLALKTYKSELEKKSERWIELQNEIQILIHPV